MVPDQVLDRTKGTRPFTFFEKGVVGHVGFADPFDAGLGKVSFLGVRCRREGYSYIVQIVSECGHALEGEGVTMHDKGTIICMGKSYVHSFPSECHMSRRSPHPDNHPEGPQFSTRAESHLYRSWGGSVINMSTLPEAKLAREAEIAYQMICMATDYDCWHSTEDVDVAMVMGHMKANADNAKRLVGAVLDRLCKAVKEEGEGKADGETVRAKKLEGTTQGMLKFMTKPEGRGEEGMRNVEYLFPGIWN